MKPKVNFIGVGHERSGSTWISQCLREHPKVNFSEPKETTFFEKLYHKGIDYYGKFYPPYEEGKICGEFTPSYCYHPEVAERIRTHYPDVKIIISLRNPVDRIFSRYKKHFYNGIETHSFSEILKRQGEVKDKYLGIGWYSDHVQTYYSLFGKENVLVLIYEDALKNPQKFIQDIYEFLGISPSFVPPSLLRNVNYRGKERVRSRLLRRIMNKVASRFPILTPVTSFIKQLNKVTHGERDKETINEKDRQTILKFYEADIKRLGGLLRRDLWSEWSARTDEQEGEK